MAEEQEVLITPEPVQAYETSKGARATVSTLETYANQSLSHEDFTCVRDHILTELEITNCHRSGVSANMTVQEVRRAKFIDNRYIIEVDKHKTRKTHGPAMACLEATLYDQLTVCEGYYKTKWLPT